MHKEARVLNRGYLIFSLAISSLQSCVSPAGSWVLGIHGLRMVKLIEDSSGLSRVAGINPLAA